MEPELDFLQLAAVHKLYSFPELALFKAILIGHVKMLRQNFKAANAVHAVDGRERVIFHFESQALRLLFVDKANQVKIELRKHNAHGLQQTLHNLVITGTLILYTY